MIRSGIFTKDEQTIHLRLTFKTWENRGGFGTTGD